MPRYSSSDHARMVDLYRTGSSLLEVGRILGCSHNTVRAALAAAGESVRPPGGQVRNAGTCGVWGRRIASNGYVVWYAWVSGENRYTSILEHRLIIAWLLGRPLSKAEEVHHRDGNRANNEPRNLELRVSPHGAGATHCPHCGGQIGADNA